MSFLDTIFHGLCKEAGKPVLQEIHGPKVVAAEGDQLLVSIQAAREFLRKAGVRKGDRCALLAANSIRWVALDLAMMADGIIAVPLYARQAPDELVAMMKDSSPAMICCGDAQLRDAVAAQWAGAPCLCLFDEVFAASASAATAEAPQQLADDDPVTIIYTSGTSGEPKGVVLNAGNVGFMLGCTNARLDQLMGPLAVPDRVFHYLPFCFAGSWILLLTCLSRSSVLALSTDLSKLPEEMALAAPNYFLNVPTLLERMRARIEEQMQQRGGIARKLFVNGRAAWLRLRDQQARPRDPLWLSLAHAFVFRKIRRRIGPQLRALICGSAPLALETQLFYFMLGLPVLQVYGLTETTAICTLDDPRNVEPGFVGPAIPGIEMKLGENNEILVRGPNVFPEYWNRPEATAKALEGGWFHTGDQAELNAAGNWRISGRLKDLIILKSGHNVAPEPLEDALLRSLTSAQQVMLVGNDRGYLAALISGEVPRERVIAAIGELNAGLPHYKQVRFFHAAPDLFTIENGLLATNGKLKRALIAERLRDVIEELYRNSQA
jgi:long-chain acyl-CoA synthetase